MINDSQKSERERPGPLHLSLFAQLKCYLTLFTKSLNIELLVVITCAFAW